MLFRIRTTLVVALLIALPSITQAADRELLDQLEQQAAVIQGLTERLEDLERDRADRAEELTSLDALENRRGVGVFDALQLDLGGFLTQTLTLVRGNDNTAISPNQTLLEILLRAKVTERTSIFAALGWLREADVDLRDPSRPFFRSQANRTPQIIAWANHRFRDSFQLRVGRFVTPHGIINIEHFPPTLLEINQPQFLRPFPGATLFPDFMNGIELHGLMPYSEGDFNYSIFGGTFAGAPEDWLGGARLAWEAAEGLTLGVNGSAGSREAGGGLLGNFSTTPARSRVSNDYQLVGVDALFDSGPWLWKTEAFFTFEEGEEDRLAFYTQPAYRLSDEWIVFYRFDHLDPGQALPTSIEHVVGVNYLPHPLIRLRGAVFLKDVRGDSSVALGQLSATLSF